MTALGSRSALVASPDTPALCLHSLARTRSLVLAHFIATPLGSGLHTCRSLSPISL